MKTLFLLLLFAVVGTALPAQKIIEENYSLSKSETLNLDFKYAQHIKITSWNKSGVGVKVSVSINGNSQNDALELKSERENGTLKLYSKLDDALLHKNWVRISKDDDSHNNHYYKGNNGDVFVQTDIVYEIFVPQNTKIIANSWSGNIEIRNLQSPDIYVKSLSGFVDVDWKESAGADISLKSISGEVYSDLAIDFENFKQNPIVGYKLCGKLKNGGSRLYLESISNDVYLRKM